MNFDCGGEHDLMVRSQALLVGERFQVQFGCLPNVGKGLLDGGTLGLAALQFWTPCVTALVVLFDHHANFARHAIILSLWARRETLRSSLRPIPRSIRKVVVCSRFFRLLPYSSWWLSLDDCRALATLPAKGGKKRWRRVGERGYSRLIASWPARRIALRVWP